MSISLEGLDSTLARLSNTINDRKLQELLTDACLLVERSAKQKAPKGNGELRRSITHKVEGDEGIVYTPLEYAPYVEFGTGLFAEGGNGRTDVPWNYQDEEGEWHSTSGQNPKPYMRPALDENREEIIRMFREGIL